MKFHVQLTIVSMFAMGIAACCSEEGKRRAGAVDPTTAAAVAVAKPAVAQDARSTRGMTLQVTSAPGVTLVATVEKAACENGLGRAAEVKVQWSVSKEGVSSVRILAAADGEQPKVWHEGGATDAQTTGPWVDGGTRLEMVDAATQEQLGSITAAATACGR